MALVRALTFCLEFSLLFVSSLLSHCVLFEVTLLHALALEHTVSPLDSGDDALVASIPQFVSVSWSDWHRAEQSPLFAELHFVMRLLPPSSTSVSLSIDSLAAEATTTTLLSSMPSTPSTINSFNSMIGRRGESFSAVAWPHGLDNFTYVRTQTGDLRSLLLFCTYDDMTPSLIWNSHTQRCTRVTRFSTIQNFTENEHINWARAIRLNKCDENVEKFDQQTRNENETQANHTQIDLWCLRHTVQLF